MAENYQQKWTEVTSLTVDAQTKFFLRAFVLDFQGKFEQVLDLCEEFKNYAAPGDRDTFKELPEFECHLFLEKRDETLTVRALRENLKAEIQLAANHNVAFVEYLLWKYQKNLKQLFTPPPEGSIPPELLAALDRAIDAYLAAKAADRARNEEIERLKNVATGKRSVQSVQAQNRVEELQGQEFAAKFAEMKALKAKKEAEKALENAPKIDPYAEEQKRLAAEQARKEEEERKTREESRNRLKNRAALWQ